MLSFFRDSTPSPTKESPLVLSYKLHFRPSIPKIFLKVQLAPSFTNFEGQRVAKRNFSVKIIQNGPKNGTFYCFFIQSLSAEHNVLSKYGLEALGKYFWSSFSIYFGSAQKIILVNFFYLF